MNSDQNITHLLYQFNFFTFFPHTTMPNQKPLTFIAVQGCSCAGKSVFTDYLWRNLKKRVNVGFIKMDDFYTGTTFDYKDERAKTYDFDNPAAINWEKVKSVITQFLNEEPIICGSKYDFSTQKRRDHDFKNNFPEIILVEGIYAFNVFNEDEFDCEILNPCKPPLEHTENWLKPNDFLKSTIEKKGCKVIKIELKMEKDKMKQIRMKRDCGTRYGNTSKWFMDTLEHRFETLIWPATEKWVICKNNNADIVIEGGSFNEDRCKEVGQKLFNNYAGTHELEEMIFDKSLNLSELDIFTK